MIDFKIVAIILLLIILVAGCAHAPQVPLTANGTCHPAQDLPAKKTMKKVPEQPTLFEDLYALFLAERADHAKDVADYNSLSTECVASGSPRT